MKNGVAAGLWIVIALLVAPPGQTQVVYRTIDANGGVLFTNDPAMATQGEVLPMPPNPDDQQVEEALQREQQLREMGKQLEQERIGREARQAKAAARQRKELADLDREQTNREIPEQISTPPVFYYPPPYIWPRPPHYPPQPRKPWPPRYKFQPGLKPAPD